MKFLFGLFSLAVAVVSASTSEIKISKDSALLKHAIPVDAEGNPRKLQQYNNYYNGNSNNNYNKNYNANSGSSSSSGNVNYAYNAANNYASQNKYNANSYSSSSYNAANNGYNGAVNGNNANVNNNYNLYHYYSNQNSQSAQAQYNNAAAGSGNYNQANVNNNQYYKIQLTSHNVLKFNRCLSVRTYPEEGSPLFDNYIVSYTKSGKAVAQKSYVFFNLCESETSCFQGDDSNLFMVDLSIYMQTLIEYLPAERNSYCKYCEQTRDYCLYGGYRRLASPERDLSANVQCSKCQAYGCFAQEEEEADGEEEENNAKQSKYIDLDEAAEWAQTYAACSATGQTLEGNTLYAGFMCNAKGNGVELAMFLDESCSAYTSTMSFTKAMDADAAAAQAGDDANQGGGGDNGYGDLWYNYLQAAKPIVQYPFTHPIRCSYMNNYANGNYNNANGDDNANYNNNNNANNNNANNNGQSGNQFCQTIYTQNSRSVSRCREALEHDKANSAAAHYNLNEDYSYKSNYNNNNNNNNNAEGDDAAANDDGQDYSVPSWYKSDLTESQSQNSFYTCKAIVKDTNKFKNSKIYDARASGSNFSYSPLSNAFGSRRVHPFTKWVIILTVLGATAYVVRYFHKLGSAAYKRNPLLAHYNDKQKELYDYHDHDDPDGKPEVAANKPDYVQMNRSEVDSKPSMDLTYSNHGTDASKSDDEDDNNEDEKDESNDGAPIATSGSNVLA